MEREVLTEQQSKGLTMHDTILRKAWPILVAALVAGPIAGCEQLPGDRGTQGAVIGGVGGGAAGAVIAGEDNRLVGALIGAALGAGGGYLVGAEMEKADADEEDQAAARESVREARENPATVAEVRQAQTADLNNDGFVTMDEVIAMARAGLTDEEMIQRLEATDYIFELTPQQQQYLIDNGVSRDVVDAMLTVNREERERILGTLEEEEEVIGQPAEEQ